MTWIRVGATGLGSAMHWIVRVRVAVVLVTLAAWLQTQPMRAEDRTEQAEGYAEWRQGDLLIVDGQRVGVTPKTKFRGSGNAKDFPSIPLGYEVKVKGARRGDGVIT